jgi:hypothetical protein
MIIYISGPITGMRNNNKHSFEKAHKKLIDIFENTELWDELKIINPIAIAGEVEAEFDRINERRFHKKNRNGGIICAGASRPFVPPIMFCSLAAGAGAKARYWNNISPVRSESPAMKTPWNYLRRRWKPGGRHEYTRTLFNPEYFFPARYSPRQCEGHRRPLDGKPRRHGESKLL